MSYNLYICSNSSRIVFEDYASKKNAITEGKRQVKLGLPNGIGWFAVDDTKTGNTVFSAVCENGYHWLETTPK